MDKIKCPNFLEDQDKSSERSFTMYLMYGRLMLLRVTEMEGNGHCCLKEFKKYNC